jgi:peptidoglycan hydrolase-like protein with peptidoglycan-binding domain
MRLVDGRDVDAAAPSEFVATRGWVREHSLEIGATLPLVTITQEQANELGFDVSDPQGPSLDGTLVGIIDGPSDLSDPTAVAIFSPALLDVGDGPATSVR